MDHGVSTVLKVRPLSNTIARCEMKVYESGDLHYSADPRAITCLLAALYDVIRVTVYKNKGAFLKTLRRAYAYEER